MLMLIVIVIYCLLVLIDMIFIFVNGNFDGSFSIFKITWIPLILLFFLLFF